MGKLTHRVALVTGASRGIGRAIAERLGADGALVAVNYARDEVAAKEVVSSIESRGGRAFAVHAELGVPGDVEKLFAGLDAGLRAQGETGEIDILVNNAGMGYTKPIEGVTPEGFERVFALNVRAAFFVTQQALTRFRDGGRIINVSSGAPRRGMAFPEGIAYGMTKGALDVFNNTLAKHLGPRGITVNGVAPGVVDTDINAHWLRGNPQAAGFAASQIALGRIGQPADIADVVAFLASDDARWVTGQVIDTSGGAKL